MTHKRKPICSTCRSEEITMREEHYWDVTRGMWLPETDMGFFCANCDDEVYIEWKEVKTASEG